MRCHIQKPFDLFAEAFAAARQGNRGEGFLNPDPHHIWHNCEVHTASAWPERSDMLFGGRHFRFSHLTDRHPEGLAAVEIFR